MPLSICTQSRHTRVMNRTVTRIVFLLFCHFPSQSYTTSGVRKAARSREVNSTGHSPLHSPSPSSFYFTPRGQHTYHGSLEPGDHGDDRDKDTRVKTYFKNNSMVEKLDAITVKTLFTDSHTSQGSSHLEIQGRNCTHRAVRYHVIDNESGTHWCFQPRHFYQLSSHDTLFCSLDVSGPQQTVAAMRLQSLSTDCDDIVLLHDANVTLVTACPSHLPTTFINDSHHATFNLTFIMTILKRLPGYKMTVNITTLPKMNRQQLKITFDSSTSGKIELADWKYNGSYPQFKRVSLQLTAPDDHIIVLHLLLKHYVCKEDNNTDYVTFRTDNNTLKYELCKSLVNLCNALAFYSGWVFIEFVNHQTHVTRNFTIAFDFQHKSQPPAELSGDRWNCSVSDWPDMWQDAPCILMFDCNNKGGEGGCWQGDGAFKQGIFQVDGRCIAMSRVNQLSTWYLEREWCQKRGGRLVTLSTKNMRLLLPVVMIVTENKMLRDVNPEYIGKRGRTGLERTRRNFRQAIGLTTMSHTLYPMYKHSLQWLDETVALTTNTKYTTGRKYCFFMEGLISYFGDFFVDLSKSECDRAKVITSRLCQLPRRTTQHPDIPPPVISPRQPTPTGSKAAFIRCPANDFTHVFLACDGGSACWSNNNGATTSCSAPLTSLPPFFKCVDVEDSVPYTLVCDHRPDCRDGSDEDFCKFPPCDSLSSILCSDKKCVDDTEVCDNQADCDDQSDEELCHVDSWNDTISYRDFIVTTPVRLDFQDGRLILNEYKTSNMSNVSCPDSYFTCTSLQQVCLPVYLRCNGLYDCPGHEDEAGCDRYTCPGYYRCRKSQVCVDDSHVCDGVYHCPQRDDELLCHETCPQHCDCHGWAFICSDNFPATEYYNLRYLDASGTSLTLAHLWNNSFLVRLSLVRCNITKLHQVTLRNLRILDLSNNELTDINSSLFAGWTSLEFLKISNNPLTHFFFQDFIHPSSLKVLDMSDVRLSEIDFGMFSFFSMLTTLNLSGSFINHVTKQGFGNNSHLRLLDVRQSPVSHFPREMFQALSRLETVFSDNYKLCCPAILPRGFNVLNCHAPSDDVSSCDDLLRSNLYRVGLAIFASLALVGNGGSLLYRLIFLKSAGNVGYDVFVTNLCVADFLMGVYLLIIGIVDHRYRGSYLWEDVSWRNSDLCKLSGFLCLLSLEVSVFIIFLITFDRFLVLRFPFSSLRFTKRSAQVACGVGWLTGVSLAISPLLPVTSHWHFYSQTSICVPLPTSRIDFPGRMYSFYVIVVLNFICFLLIFVGQVFLYWSIRSNSMCATSTSRAANDFTIARRLVTVAMSDFLCWFPVGLAGILASYDIPVFGEVNVGIAIFVLPVNSALNPFLYTLNIYLERRRRKIEEERRKHIIAQLKLYNGQTKSGNRKVKMTDSDAPDIVKILVSMRVLSLEDLARTIEENVHGH